MSEIAVAAIVTFIIGLAGGFYAFIWVFQRALKFKRFRNGISELIHQNEALDEGRVEEKVDLR